MLSSTFLTELSLVLRITYSHLEMIERIQEGSILLVDRISRRKIKEKELITIFKDNFDSIILNLVRNDLSFPISETDLIEKNIHIFGQYANINDLLVLDILTDIIKTHFNIITEKISAIRENIDTRDRERKNRQIKVETFEWRESNGDIPKVVKNFIKKRTRFGSKSGTVKGSMLPKALIMKRIVKLTYTITEDDIIAKGLISKKLHVKKLKNKIFICPICTQSFNSQSQKSSHMKTAHKKELEKTTIVSLVREYLGTSSNDYRKMDRIKQKLKAYLNIVKICNSCSIPIELRDYYKNQIPSKSIEKLVNKWKARNSWILCPKCEKKKDRIKKYLF